MDYLNWVPNRIAELRMQKGWFRSGHEPVPRPERKLYKQIENKRTMPSMAGFFYICEYFGITPQEFFNSDQPLLKRFRNWRRS